ncbi:MAG: serine hydrolase [Victivallales bacterium]|nr:serine hydrolase [Victivallales bacterium]
MANLNRTTPESVGIPSAVLCKFLTELKSLDSLNSVMLLRHGSVCMEGWWKPYRPELNHILFSLSKSFTSLAVGFAQAEGKLSVKDTLIGHFPEYESCVTDERMRKVTLEDLLTMRSGHASCARPACLADPDGNWARGFISSQFTWEPGTHFAYNSAGTYMLAAVVRKVTGLNCREYLLPRLFIPLDINPGPWECCPKGVNMGGWGLYLKTEDLAKVGQLMLQNGVWNGRQIVPVDYLNMATAKHADNSMNEAPDWKTGYGYQFWRSRHGFRGDGASGQFMVVLPEEDMVFITTAGMGNMQSILDIAWDNILPNLWDTPLPENPAAQAELQTMLDSLEMPLAIGDISRRHEPAEWCFDGKNTAGVTHVSFRCEDDECVMEFRSKHGLETLRAGFGHPVCNQHLQLADHLPRLVAADAAWTSENTLEIHVTSYEASFRDVFVFDFGSATEPITARCRFNTFRNPFLDF